MKPSTQAGVNAERSYILISSSSSKDGVKLFQGTPINLDDDSPATPAAVTSEDTRASEPHASVAFQMPLHSTIQQGYSSSPIAFFPFYLFPECFLYDYQAQCIIFIFQPFIFIFHWQAFLD
jgi:hypothetical protein